MTTFTVGNGGGSFALSANDVTLVSITATAGREKRGEISRFDFTANGGLETGGVDDPYVLYQARWFGRLRWSVTRVNVVDGVATPTVASPLDDNVSVAATTCRINYLNEPSQISGPLYQTASDPISICQWRSSQASQALIFPAVAGSGLLFRASSSNYPGRATCNVIFDE